MRPQYHYAAAANWLSDPNGLVYHQGIWHLFYQYNPLGEDWGHMSWGHAISHDLAEWQEQPVAIAEDAQHMIFSGAAIADPGGAAGFGRDALIALYTASAAHGPAHQSQALAWSTDQGQTWQRYAGNPVIDRGLADFRDPNLFWHGPTGRWIMVVALSAENRALIYASSDLKQWDELSVIHGAGAPGRVWECPLLIELPVEGTDETRWLFKVDVLHDGPGAGAIYQTGTFDGIRFQPDGPALDPIWQVADHGRDFYAAVAWHEPRDNQRRPVWIGWMGNHAYQGQLPQQGWRGAMSVPRRLSLGRSPQGFWLRQEPEPAAIAGVHAVQIGTTDIGQAARLEITHPADFSMTIEDCDGRLLEVVRQSNRLAVARRDPGSPFLDAQCTAPIAAGEPVCLWLDCGSLEIVSNDGRTALTLQHRLSGDVLSVHYEQAAEIPAFL
ncbi:MAG: glycoside hydrolase family 32 protein [Novosphingobium sp.]|uniref:glycoside hydrolase family 32 protein n=1 Tax=Novosphingobium sp. TaxID=1874826 RepID=UPI0032BE075F